MCALLISYFNIILGRWWLVGSAWAGRNAGDNDVIDDATTNTEDETKSK
jgi:hypothetical protein